MSTQVLSLFLMLVLASSVLAIAYADPIRPSDNAAKRNQLNQLSKSVENHNCNIAELKIRLKNTTDFVSIYNSSSWCGTTQNPPVPVPVEICGNGIDDDKDGQIDEGCQVPVGSIPALDTSKTFRIMTIADIDDNSGLTTQANLAKKYNVQLVVIPGDLDYNSISNVFKRLADAGFDKTKLVVADGNHDDCSDIRDYLSIGSCFYEKYVSDAKINIITLKGTSVGCSDTQLANTKSKLEDSDAWYNIINIHQPFATVKSDHGPNGGFSCYHPIFKANGVNMVLQGHVHNYQYGVIDNIVYGVYGTGTHDSGSAMYDCDSSSFNSVPFKCITGTNGITVLDFQIADPNIKKINGYFVSNADKLVHSFTVGGN